MKRSKFSLSHYKLFTSDMGMLIPIGWYEALPGDTIQHATSMLVRCSPLLAPVMHPVRIRIHHWFVPNRLVWSNWENFITGGKDGNDASVPPYITLGTVAEGSLLDYLGVPPGTYSNGVSVSALPVRAYNLIFNDGYRDQDLVDEVPVAVTDGADTTTPLGLLNCAWEKDYFTTARPWEQKGDQVNIPIDIVGQAGQGPTFNYGGMGPAAQQFISGDNKVYWGASASSTGNATWGDPKLEASSISVNDLRLSLAIQRYQEARAQYGSRYVEYLRYLGVRSSDARLQDPEYLGGGRQVIQFSEIIKTGAGEDPAEPIGTLKGHGLAAMRTGRFRRFFEEHGVVLTLMSVVPKAIYTSALHRQWLRTIKEEYFQKELQFIGQQAIPNKEVHAMHATPNGTFGFQNRYDEYRSVPSNIAGEYHSTLDYWHMARSFAVDPALNSSFVQAVPTKRVFASQATHVLYCMARHSIQARRMLARYAKPKTF